MVVVTPVAVDTFTLQFLLEIVSLVTGIAFCLIMGAPQGKLGFVVIEFGLRPTSGVMAFVTFFTKPSLMNIVESMTGKTFQGCLFITLIGMTAVTRHLPVFSRQLEFCLIMIKLTLCPRLL